MKTILQLFICLMLLEVFFPYKSLSQSTFEWSLPYPEDAIPMDGICDSLGNFYLTILRQDTIRQVSVLLKINSRGDTIKSRVFMKDSVNGFILKLFPTYDGNYMAAGQITTGNPPIVNNAELWFVKFDSSLNVLFEKRFQTPFVTIDHLRSIPYKGLHLVFGFGDFGITTSFVIKITDNGDTLLIKTITNNGKTLRFYDALYQPNSQRLNFFGRAFVPSLNTYGQIFELDSLFNIIHVDSIPEGIFSGNNARWIDDIKFLLTGEYLHKPSATQDNDLGLISLDTSNYVYHHQNFGKPDTIDYPACGTNLDFNTLNNIYYGGTANQFIPPSSANAPSWFILNKIDTACNLIWQKFYGGDTFYNLFGIIASPDGGCLLYGNLYDYITQDERRDVYVLKVNQDGELLSISEKNPIKVKEVIVYPNPGSDQIIIRTALKAVSMRLYNVQGDIILSQKINNPITTISTASFASGAYFLHFIKEGKRIDTWKWVKN